MIYVERSRVQQPSVLRSPTVLRELDRVRSFATGEVAMRKQRTLDFAHREWMHPEVRQALSALFHRKCAYCEQPVDEKLGSVEHYRPKSETTGLMHGEYFPLHYWWLAFEWTNLLPSCRACNAAKRSRFPIRGTRADWHQDPGRREQALAAEEPLLIDPCTPGALPENLLVFERSGSVGSQSERGRITIEVLHLNRPELVSQRGQDASLCLEQLRQLLAFVGGYSSHQVPLQALVEPLSELTAGERPFAALRRQLAIAALIDSRLDPLLVQEVFASIPALDRMTKRGQQDRLQIVEDFERGSKAREAYAVDDEAATGSYYLTARMIERVQIRNFKAIADLDLSFGRREEDFAQELAEALAQEGVAAGVGPDPPPVERDTPWTVLLGENASGKSTVLQAIALTLVGREYRQELEIDARDCVRRPRCTKGWVKVHLSGHSEPIELRFSKSSSEFEGDEDPKVLLLAFGSTRLLPRGDHEPAAGRTYARIDNLFDPFVPLEDASGWLVRLAQRDEETFDQMAVSLKRLLDLPEDVEFSADAASGRVVIGLHGAQVSLEELSDGYQSVVALATDIMSVMLDKWASMTTAEGIVLLDELGSHLHPRWQMRIVDVLRDVFPHVQFLASTHNPLCLRGLLGGEVVLMRRDARGRIHVLPDLPSVKGLTVNQLLTSEHFGLSTTLDPRVEAVYDRYRELLLERRPTRKQRAELERCRRILAQYDQMGQSRRERLMLEAIDRHLAREERELGRVPAAEWDARLQRELDAILSAGGGAS